MDKTIHVIIGPTASGKSALALQKAQDLNGVIINCDAMQSYDALPILTAQPSAEDKAAAPHRLYAHLHPAATYSAADWRVDAIREVETAWKNGQTPILCGGSGFYLKALTDGLSPIPDIPETVRQEVTAEHETIGTEALYQKLKDADPTTAAQIDPMNPMRVMRAWEVWKHTGKSLADWQKEPLEGAPKGWQFHVTALLPEREALVKKINDRLDVMVKNGALEEVSALDDLIQKGEIPDNALIVKAHGFRPFRRHLNGEWTLDEAIEYTQTETRQYAKRQMTWLRHQIRIDDIMTV